MSNKSQSLEERCDEIAAVSEAAGMVDALKTLSRQPKLSRNREERRNAWNRLANLAMDRTHKLGDANPVMPKIAFTPSEEAFNANRS